MSADQTIQALAGAALFTGARLLYRKEGYSVGSIEFDLMMSEEHMFENEVTSHRVQEGSEITDNIRRQLREGNLVGMVSNYSIQEVNPFIGGVLPGQRPDNKVQRTYDLFKQLWKQQTPLSIVTILEKEAYNNVAIKNITASRDPSSNESQRFEVSFRQIEIATFQQVSQSPGISPGPMDNNLSRQSAPTSNQGRTIGQ